MRTQLIEAIQDGCTKEQAIDRMIADGLYYRTGAENFIRICGVEFPLPKETPFCREEELHALSTKE